MRSYGQHCSLARSLDLLGERWTMLVIRELMLGPARYRDLLDALPGIGTNLLSTRLKALEAAGIITKGPTAYELGERGEELRPVIEDFARWGMALMREDPGEDFVQPRWAALLMRATMARADGPRVEGVFAFDAGGDAFWLRSTADRVDLRRGPAPVPPDATVRCDTRTFFAVAIGTVKPREALASGALTVDGDRRAAERLLKAFRLPVPA